MKNSGTVDFKKKANYFMMTIYGALVFAVVFIYIIATDIPSPQQQALIDFSRPVEDRYVKYPLRLDGYARRFWRSDINHLPVILNLDRAECSAVRREEWPKMLDFYSKTIGDMVEDEFLPIWIMPEHTGQAHDLWEKLENKKNISYFYSELNKRKINFYAMDEYYDLLMENGFSKEMIYVCSLLLVPGFSEEYKNSIFETSPPVDMLLCEFYGERGMRLIDTGTGYDTLRLPDYQGLLLGFDGLEGHSGEYWRILDIHVNRPMSYFYEKAENPLLNYAKMKYDELHARRLSESEPNPNIIDDIYEIPERSTFIE